MKIYRSWSLKPSASADITLLDLHNSSYLTQPRPIVANKAVEVKSLDFWHIYSNKRIISAV